jgi:hypothetical protein
LAESNLPQTPKHFFSIDLQCQKIIDPTKKTYPSEPGFDPILLTTGLIFSTMATMAAQSPKHPFNPKQTASNPKTPFSPLFINAKSH